MLFAQQSCSVYAADYDADGVVETVRQITECGGTTIATEIDVADESANEQLIADCVAAFGGLHIFFANAGIMGSTQPFWELDAEEWIDTLQVNCVGVAMGFKFAARYKTTLHLSFDFRYSYSPPQKLHFESFQFLSRSLSCEEQAGGIRLLALSMKLIL